MKLTLAIVRRINFIITSTLSALYLTGKILRGKKLKSQLELKKDDKIVPVPSKLNSLIEDILKDIKSKGQLVNEILPFMSSNIDVGLYGISAFGSKTLLAIPYHFLYDSVNDADFKVMVNDKEIPANTPDFNHLKLHVCLSEEAKGFALARGIYEAQHSEIFSCGFVPLIIVMNCNMMSFFIQKFTQKRSKPHFIGHHGAVYICGIWLFFVLYNVFSFYAECQSDFLATKLDKSYVRGGIEYYEKMLKRNKILKKIDSSLPIREDGEIKYSFFRMFQAPISKKLNYLEDISKAKNPSVWEYIF